MGFREWRAVFRRPVLVAILLGVGSVGLVGTGVFAIATHTHEQAQFVELSGGRGVEVDATLSEVHASSSDTTRTARRPYQRPELCPIYTFTADGRAYSVLDQTDCSTRSEDFTPGDSVAVLYDPLDPTVAFVDTAETRSRIGNAPVFSIASIVVGVVLALVSPFAVVRARARARRRR
ncbi:DUF3592 domain-containing protein [Labedella endophytica]|uniref:DUF3592 domain-containing protein n=1 Tax=Labedella endophytica TaxID=1523160 RepID=A0A433JND1_9MICO|nr:DUF3592 domain-containing protein [Labedella endophytica]RUQ97160.1 DUF3592 domain-containing protein [Labedella endophytica]